MSHTPPTPESELVARLRERDAKWLDARSRKHPDLAAALANIADDIRDAAATIERLASAHEQGRREGIDALALVEHAAKAIAKSDGQDWEEIREEDATYEDRCDYRRKAHAAIAALSPAPPPEKGERIPSGEEEAFNANTCLCPKCGHYIQRG